MNGKKQPITKRMQVLATVDRRIWWMIIGISFFGIIIMKEVSIPKAAILGMGVFGLLGLLMVGLESPEIPFYVLLAYIPFSRLLVGDFGTQLTAFNMTNILCLWVFISYAIRQSSRGQPLFQGAPLNRAVLAFAALGAAALLRASWAYGSWYIGQNIIALKQWLTPMFFYFLAFWVARDRKTIKTSTVVIMVAVTMVAVMAIREYEYVKDSDFDNSRVGGIVEHSNTLAAFFVYYMFLFVGYFLVFSKSKLKVWLLLVPFLLAFRGIMVTFSRGAYLACAFAGLVATWMRNKLLFFLAIGMGLFALANPWMLPGGIRYRVGMTVTGDIHNEQPLETNLEASSAHRIEIWKGAVEMIKENPVWGVGYGAFPQMIPRYVTKPMGLVDAHNSYLLIAAEMGIPTLLVFLVLLVMAMYYTYWLWRRTEDPSIKAMTLGFFAGLMGLMVCNMFGSRMDSQEAAGYFWVLCGLVMRGVLIEREEHRAVRADARPSRRSSAKPRLQSA